MKPNYWAGSEETWEAYQASLKSIKEYEARTDRQEIQVPNLYQRVGNVGTISVTGSLVSGKTSPLYQYFGIIGYENIKEAVLEGVKDKSAATLMLIGKSGGGAVDGCASAAEFIRGAAAAKPMSAYAEFAASACYWLISAAPHITLADTGVAGSIGIIRIVSEYSQMDKKEGITRTVLRAGENKARINPYEPLTDKARADEQKKLDYLHDRFIGTVAHQRGVSKAEVKRNYGDGSTFIGTMALDVGLVDAVGDMSAALNYAKANKIKLDKSKVALVVTPTPANMPDNSAKLINGKTSMDEDLMPSAEDLAVIAGVTVPVPENTPANTPEAKAPEVLVPDTAVTALEAQVAAKDGEIATLTAAAEVSATALATAEAALAAANETIEALSPAVRNSVKHLAVPLNKKVDAATLAGKELAQAYTEMSTAYAAAFKAGTVSKQPVKVGTEGEQTNKPTLGLNVVDPLFALKAKTIK